MLILVMPFRRRFDWQEGYLRLWIEGVKYVLINRSGCCKRFLWLHNVCFECACIGENNFDGIPIKVAREWFDSA